MSRDFRKLRVFQLADDLLLRVYRISSEFPAVERYSLQAQLRRAALSTSANIVDCCATPGSDGCVAPEARSRVAMSPDAVSRPKP
jgi:hypothetical protein